MVAPYILVDQENGIFELRENPAKDAPQAAFDELRLAEAITSRVRWKHDNPRESAYLSSEYLDELKRIALAGLVNDEGRDVASVIKDFERQFGALDPHQDGGGSHHDLTDSNYYVSYNKKIGEIVVSRISNGKSASDDERLFIDELAQKERFINALIERGEDDDTRRRDLLDRTTERLLWAARIGLHGLAPDLPLGRLAINSITDDIKRRYGQSVRYSYLKELGITYVKAAVAVLVIGIVLEIAVLYITWLPREFLLPPVKIAFFAVALLFLFFGAWLSALVRLQPDSPEVLLSIFSTTLRAGLHVFLVFGFGFLSILLLYKQVIVFSLGAGEATGFTTVNVLTNLATAILTGAFLGLSEAALPSAVIQRSANLVAALKGK